MSNDCLPCSKYAELPCNLKLALALSSTPNIALTLNALHFSNQNLHLKLLVTLDARDRMLWFHQLHGDSAKTAFEGYLCRQFSNFDALTSIIADTQSNIPSSSIRNKLLKFSSQFCPISTKALWSIGNNERSYWFLRKPMVIVLATETADYAANNCNLLSAVKIKIIYNQHSNKNFPYYNKFGVIPRVIGQTDEIYIQRIFALIENLRLKIAENRGRSLILKIFNSYHRYDISLRTYHPNQKVCFYR